MSGKNPREGFFGVDFDTLAREFQESIEHTLEEYPQAKRALDYARLKVKDAWTPKAEEVDATIARFLAYTNVAEYALQQCIDHAPTPEASNEASQALNHLLTSRNPKVDQ